MIADRLNCPLCGCWMTVRNGKNGKFWGCSRYPECNGTDRYEEPPPVQPITGDLEAAIHEKTKIALKFVKDMGSAYEARYWLDLAFYLQRGGSIQIPKQEPPEQPCPDQPF